MVVRGGSQASSGLPVTDRAPETTQLFEPVGVGAEPERLPDLCDLACEVGSLARVGWPGVVT